jgi:hypothetical protein
VIQSDLPVTAEQFKEATEVLPRPMCTGMLAYTFTCEHVPKACARVCTHKLVQACKLKREAHACTYTYIDADIYRREYVQTRIHTDVYTYRRVHGACPSCVYISDDACKMYVRTWTPRNTNPLYLPLTQVLRGRPLVSMQKKVRV